MIPERYFHLPGLKLFSVVVLVWVSIGLLVGCQQTGSSVEPDKLTFQLPWQHQAQFAGYYAAEKEGFYAAENIDITFIPRGPREPLPGPVVAEGKAQFGVVGAAPFIKDRSEDRPVVAVAVIYQEIPTAFAALTSSGIERPEDFVDHRVGIQPGNDVAYAAMMANLGIDRSQIKESEVDFDLARLYNGEVDVLSVWITNEAITLRQEGYEANVFLAADYGVSVYSDVLFTTEEMIAQKPDLVKRMVRASLRGWQFAIEHEKDAVDAVMSYLPNGDRELQEAMLNTSIRLINPGGVAVGSMDPAKWQQTYDILLKYGAIDKPLDIKSAYTLEFLEKTP